MYLIILFLFFLVQSFKVFSNFIKVEYILLRFSTYKDVCERMYDSETSDFKKDLLATEIHSMDHSTDIVNSTLKTNPFRLLREINNHKRFIKSEKAIQQAMLEDLKK